MILPEEVPGTQSSGVSLDLNQIEQVIAKVEESMVEYLRIAPSLQLTIKPQHLIQVIEAAISEAQGNPPEGVFSHDQMGFFLYGLYEDIIQHPSNIFETVVKNDGKSYYVPLKPELWEACLQQLRLDVEELDMSMPLPTPVKSLRATVGS